MRWLTAYLATAVCMLAMDFTWLTLTAGFYRRKLGALLLAQPHMVPAVLFYLIYIFGVVMFVVMPALRKATWRSAALPGGLFGLVAYATYDLTNLATLNGFPATLAAADLAWGFTISAASASVGYAVARKLG